ncbi:PEX1 [[Candida] subhashii]|uniref:Peroxisomal ATPase PEX1 n=1 Tax=[Candida] subhashii TaxID=561895 RepID=A0A8J5QSU1_9ASCO|nr:PEX1 [[Candida] subhashii]KAG7664567.1 PEX1 [[Candida] subhashii]
MDNHKSTIKLKTLKSNLINLPSHLSNLLFTANIQIQDVIIELVSTSTRAKSKQSYYAGWSGMSSSDPSSIEIDPIFATSLGLVENDSIIINLKINNHEATNINLEPVSSSDWEVVELHAQHIEDKLLSQTRCVAIGQILIVYPNQSTHAKLIVTDIGSDDKKYAKISPYAEIAIAPKVRQEKKSTTAGGPPSSKGSVSNKTKTTKEDYGDLPSVLKRGISLPHKLYDNIKLNEGYIVYANFNELPQDVISDYVAVSVIPGPNDKPNGSGNNIDEANTDLKENKRIIAKLLDFKDGIADNIGVSQSLAIALHIENQVGNIIVLKPAIKNLPRRPTTFTIHPYITQSKRKDQQINLNNKQQSADNNKLIQQITEKLYPGISKSCMTNYTKIPIIPNILPNGGLLKFRKNDDPNSWIKPYSLDSKKPIRIEIGEELLRAQSFIQTRPDNTQEDEAIGLDAMIEDIVESFVDSPNTGSLIYGNSGSGKTLLLQLVSKQLVSLGIFTKFISCESIMNENYNSLVNKFQKWIQTSNWHKPAVIVLDNLDKILPCELDNVDNSKSNQLTEFLISSLAKIHNQQNSNLSILISATSKESLNKLLSGSHVLENYIHLSPPNKPMRHDILTNYITARCPHLDIDIMDLVAETEGYLPNDLKTLSDRIYHEYLFSQPAPAITQSHIDKALAGYTPANLRGVNLQKSSTTTSWSDIGGLSDAKTLLLETLEWPTKYAPIFKSCPLRLRSGILLYGYPGCGKTLLASAVASQCGLNFIAVKGPEILNKYIGASEASVRELFERAQAARPCVLFLDEFDSIAPKRGHDSTGVTDRVVNQMLTQMDGAEGLGEGVYVLAATSRPDLIDSALLRPGRLDKAVICDMPTYEDRMDILKCVTRKMELGPGVDLEEVAKGCGGFSGADIQGLCYNAYLKAVHLTLDEMEKKEQSEGSVKVGNNKSIEFFQVDGGSDGKKKKLRSSERVKLLHQIEQFMNNEDDEEGDKQQESDEKDKDENKVIITHQNFLDSLKETKPSISFSEKTKLSKIYHQFLSGRDGNMPDGSASNEIGGRTTLM